MDGPRDAIRRVSGDSHAEKAQDHDDGDHDQDDFERRRLIWRAPLLAAQLEVCQAPLRQGAECLSILHYFVHKLATMISLRLSISSGVRSLPSRP
jgi:hypothetical protein